jgi:hypothetical protein
MYALLTDWCKEHSQPSLIRCREKIDQYVGMQSLLVTRTLSRKICHHDPARIIGWRQELGSREHDLGSNVQQARDYCGGKELVDQ